MKYSLILLSLFFSLNSVAQVEDYRCKQSSYTPGLSPYYFARKEADINTAILKAEARIGKGYRLMILNTNDREYAMKIRGELCKNILSKKPICGLQIHISK